MSPAAAADITILSGTGDPRQQRHDGPQQASGPRAARRLAGIAALAVLAVSAGTPGPASGAARSGSATATVARFAVTLRATALAGGRITVSVKAVDAGGSVVTGFRGSIRLTSSDALATLPADYAFTATDRGVHTFGGVVLRTPGGTSVTASETGAGAGGATGSGTTTVDGGTVARFTLSAPASAASGSAVAVTVTPLNAAGLPIAGYRGTVRFSSTDPAATLPGEAAFTAADAGSRTFAITLRSDGGRAVIVRDAAGTAAYGSTIVTVRPGSATHLVVTVPAAAVAGGALPTTVSARDDSENIVPSFRGTVTLTASDDNAAVPPAYAFTAADAGRHTFGGVALRSLGSQTLTATSGTLTGSTTVTVGPGPVTRFSVSAPATAVSGAATAVTVRAVNSADHIVAGYRGTVTFGSSDSLATLPGPVTFAAGDAGVTTVSITLRSAGSRTVTVQDAGATSLRGQAATAVTAGDAASLTVTAASTTIAGAALLVRVTARDAAGNVASGFRSTVRLSSSDRDATLPADYTFTAADAGVHAFVTPVLRTPGSQTVTVTGGPATGSATTTVGTGAVTRFSLTGPSTVAAGAGGTWTVRALNSAGHRVASYRGTVRFTSNDPAAELPAETAFTADDAGTRTFTLTPRTSGTRLLTVRDTLVYGAVGQAVTSVTGGTATRITLTTAATVTAGLVSPVTITARDIDGNVATGFRGTIHLASTDPGAVLPGDYTFTGGDSGVHTFTTPRHSSAGGQTLTVSSGSLWASAAITVVPGAVARFDISIPSTSLPGRPLAMTVTAYDVGGNVASGYRGSIRLTSTDVTATLAPDYSFTADDAGSHAFTVTLRTAGAHNVAVRSTISWGLKGAAPVVVTAG